MKFPSQQSRFYPRENWKFQEEFIPWMWRQRNRKNHTFLMWDPPEITLYHQPSDIADELLHYILMYIDLGVNGSPLTIEKTAKILFFPKHIRLFSGLRRRVRYMWSDLIAIRWWWWWSGIISSSNLTAFLNSKSNGSFSWFLPYPSHFFLPSPAAYFRVLVPRLYIHHQLRRLHRRYRKLSLLPPGNPEWQVPLWGNLLPSPNWPVLWWEIDYWLLWYAHTFPTYNVIPNATNKVWINYYCYEAYHRLCI